MNRKGQALIEFVLILPILIILLFSIIDFGNIFMTKNSLENDMELVYDKFKTSADIISVREEVNDLINQIDKNIDTSISFNDETKLITIKLSKKVNTITPGINLVIGYPYYAKVERVIKYAEQ